MCPELDRPPELLATGDEKKCRGEEEVIIIYETESGRQERTGRYRRRLEEDTEMERGRGEEVIGCYFLEVAPLVVFFWHVDDVNR